MESAALGTCLVEAGWWPVGERAWRKGHELVALEKPETTDYDLLWLVEPDRVMRVDRRGNESEGRPGPRLAALLARARTREVEPAAYQALLEREAGEKELARLRAWRPLRATWTLAAVITILLWPIATGGFSLARLFCLGASFPPITLHGEPWRLLTSAFLHIEWWHWAGNLVMVLWLGYALEPYLGPLRMAALFVAGSLGGAVASSYWNPIMTAVGASGGIYTWCAAYLWLLARGRRLPVRLRPRPQGCLVGLLVTDLALTPLASNLGGFEVDLAAHVGGFVTGLLLGAVLVRPLQAPRAPLAWVAVVALLIPAAVLGVHSYVTRPTLARYAPRAFASTHYTVELPGIWERDIRPGELARSGPGMALLVQANNLSEDEAVLQLPADQERLLELWTEGTEVKVRSARHVESAGRHWVLCDAEFPPVVGQIALALEGGALYQLVVYSQPDGTAAARELLEGSLATVKPTLWGAPYYLGKARSLARKSPNMAYQQLQNALKAGPEDFAVAVQVAESLRRLKRPAEAVAVADKAVKLAQGDDELARALNERAWILATTGRPREGLVDAEASLALLEKGSRGWGNTIDTRGTALLGLGKPAEALRDFDAALSVQDDPAGHCHRGQALEALGRKAEARKEYQRTLELQPEGEYASVAKARLQRK